VSEPAKSRVLFVCIGNSCRSQMAEGFARTYGSDVLVAASAGLAPAAIVAGDTIRVMADKNIDLSNHFPKSLAELGEQPFDLVVNMSGFHLPRAITSPARDWDVADPIGEDFETYCQICDQIERLVMGLILELRRQRKS